jgi:hypothetical protein
MQSKMSEVSWRASAHGADILALMNSPRLSSLSVFFSVTLQEIV